MKKPSKFRRRWLRFPLYLLILGFLLLPGESPVRPLLEDGKNLVNRIFTQKDIRIIFYALENHYRSRERYPDADEFDRWLWETFRGDFTLQNPVDRWGRPLAYLTTPAGDGFRLMSLGKDGVAGTKDDFGVEVFYLTPENLP